ncbi:hypothetical protein WJX72_012431 [[Myrmecia] bisecta]|uniref:Uncharacterized protein n=1 Tax=[Myrmecia] bisecta TaxID=41462 RepID=A0AAW1P6P2_9CHLO
MATGMQIMLRGHSLVTTAAIKRIWQAAANWKMMTSQDAQEEHEAALISHVRESREHHQKVNEAASALQAAQKDV